MRTTVNLDPDVAAAVERLRRDAGLGLSEALNDLARRGMGPATPTRPYVHRSKPMGLRVDVSNVGDVLDLLDQE
jgi:hypothetical protein